MSLSQRLSVTAASCLLIVCFVTPAADSDPAGPEIPTVPGVTFVIAVSDASSASATTSSDNVAQGDYETVVTMTDASKAGIDLTAFIDGIDAAGASRQVSVARQVLAADLMSSHLQILGFNSSDPRVLSGTTSLGPSIGLIRELQSTRQTAYSFRTFFSRESIDGTLHADTAHVRFPVLLNGHRVEFDAIRATAQMSSGTARRPFEQIILDHPVQPLSLRIAYGPRGGSFPFEPEFAREIVRIDFPSPAEPPLDEALEKNCRVELPGVYFDFNDAALRPGSMRALGDVATTIRKHPQWQLTIEGHTDNIGGEHYNDDLSMRRAQSVKTALADKLSVDVTKLSTKGWGLRHPVESNNTLAGRARNRRVELVRQCGK